MCSAICDALVQSMEEHALSMPAGVKRVTVQSWRRKAVCHLSNHLRRSQTPPLPLPGPHSGTHASAHSGLELTSLVRSP